MDFSAAAADLGNGRVTQLLLVSPTADLLRLFLDRLQWKMQKQILDHHTVCSVSQDLWILDSHQGIPKISLELLIFGLMRTTIDLTRAAMSPIQAPSIFWLDVTPPRAAADGYSAGVVFHSKTAWDKHWEAQRNASSC
jgi:hypothetical protein